MNTEQKLELWMEVKDADDAEVERLSIELRKQLEELDVEAIEQIPGGAAPEGAKALDWVLIGGLLVKLGPGAVSAVVRTVQAWVERDPQRSVTIKDGDRELVLTAATPDQQQQLIDAFVAGRDG